MSLAIKIEIYNKTTDAQIFFVNEPYLKKEIPTYLEKGYDDLYDKMLDKRMYKITDESFKSGLFSSPSFQNTTLVGSAEDGSEFFGQYYNDRIITINFDATKVIKYVNGVVKDSLLNLNETLEQWDKLNEMWVTIDDGVNSEREFQTFVAKSENSDLANGTLELIELNHGLFYYAPFEFQSLTGSTGTEIKIYSKYENMPLIVRTGAINQFGVKNLSNKQEFLVKSNVTGAYLSYMISSYSEEAIALNTDYEEVDLISSGEIKGSLITLKRGWNTLQITGRDTPVTLEFGTRLAQRVCF